MIKKILLQLLCLFTISGCSSIKNDCVEYLSPQKRIEYLIDIYTSINNYFVGWFDLDEISYKDRLSEALLRVTKPIDAYEYCTILEEITAVTKDAHNVVYRYPKEILDSFGYLTYDFEYIDGKYYVTGVSENSQVPLWTELVGINGQSIDDYLEQNVSDLVPAGANILRQNRMLQRFTFNRNGTEIQLSWKLSNGKKKDTKEVYNKNERRIISKADVTPDFSKDISKTIRKGTDYDVYILNDKIVYFDLHKMTGISGSLFQKVYPEIKNYKNFIFDIRDNGGGSDLMVEEIMSMFFNTIKIFPTYTFCVNFEGLSGNSKMQNQREYEISDSYDFDLRSIYWDKVPELIEFDNLVLLQNYNSLSAAESFALISKGIDELVSIGTNTAGSCGFRYDETIEELEFSFSYITKGSLDYNYQSVFSVGINPDIYVEQSYDDLMNNKDTILEYAIAYME